MIAGIWQLVGLRYLKRVAFIRYSISVVFHPVILSKRVNIHSGKSQVSEGDKILSLLNILYIPSSSLP
jgi:hypothetical protein